jgi:hypothetical protein
MQKHEKRKPVEAPPGFRAVLSRQNGLFSRLFSPNMTEAATKQTRLGRSHLVLAFSACLAVLASGCGSGVTEAVTVEGAQPTTGGDPVPTTLTLSPSSATLAVGATQQLTATVTDQRGNPMSGFAATYQSSNEAAATVSSTGLVNAVAAGQATITASVGGRSGTAQIEVTAPVSGAGAPPIARAVWISKAELDALPMSGTAWSGSGELKSIADASWRVQGVEVYSKQRYAKEVMAGALVFARMYPDPAAEAYRTKVVQAIRTVIARPDDRGSNITGVNRFIGSWAIIADLINLPAHDPALDTQLRAWLNHKLDMQLESSGKTVRTQITHANNHGSWATFSVAAVAAYTGDRSTLDLLATRYRRWLGNTSASYTLKWTDAQSFQVNPNNSATWVGINPKGAVRDGHNFDGIQPSDLNRGTPETYNPAAFPNSAVSHRYPETSLHGVVGAVLILHRAGYTDLVDASDQAILRAAKWIKYAADNFSGAGYMYFTGPHEAARPLINYLYPSAGLPSTRERSQNDGQDYGFGWTYWTHAGRRLR